MPEAEISQNATPARRPWWKRVLRIFFWTGGVVTFLVLVLVLLTFIYQDEVKGYMIEEVNKRVNTAIIVDPADIDLTIIRSFPDVTVEFKNVAALDATTAAKRDTLLKAGKITFSFNLPDLFRNNYTIRDISVEDATLKIWVDEKGKDNYHLLKETPDIPPTGGTDSSHVNFELSTIAMKNMTCMYSDKRDNSFYNVTFADLEFTGDFGEEKYEFGTDGDFTVTTLQHGKSSYLEGNSGHIELLAAIDNATGTYTLNTGKLKLSNLALNITGSIAEKKENYLLDLAVAGENIDLAAFLSLLPSSYSEDTEGLESTGEFYLDGTVKGLMGDSATPDVNAKFGIKDGATIARKGSSVKLTNVSLKGLFSNEKGKEGVQLSSFTASTSRSKFSGSFTMSGFKRPQYKAGITGHIDLSELQEILQVDTIGQVSGTLDLEVSAAGAPAKGTTLSASDFRAFKTSGQARLTNAQLMLKDAKFPTDSINGKLSFDGNNVTVENFTARAANSDIRVNGTVRNLLGYLFLEKEVLDVSGKLVSDNLDLNTLLADEGGKNTSDSVYRLELPERLKLNFSTSIKHVSFRKFEANDLTGDVHLNKRRLVADPVSFRAMDGTIGGSGMIDGTRVDSLLITCNADISDVNIYKLFYQMENFGQEGEDTVITYNNLRGSLTSHVNFASLWGNDLEVNEKKIYAGADITVSNGRLINFLPLDVLSRFIQLEDLRDIHFKSLHNTIEIKNRVISLPKMEIKSSAINVTMWGTHDFDNMVDYHFIVDMDELRAKKAKAAKKQNTEFGQEIDDGGHRTRLFLLMKGYIGDPDVRYELKSALKTVGEEVKQEGKNLKQILNEEFGWFKGEKGKENKEDRKKEDDSKKFILIQDEDSPKKKKKKEELDDSEDY